MANRAPQGPPEQPGKQRPERRLDSRRRLEIPSRPREVPDRIAEIHGRHDAAQLELDAADAKADAEIEKGLTEGNADRAAVKAQAYRRLKFLARLGPTRAFFAHRTVRDLPRVLREALDQKKPPQEVSRFARQRLSRAIELNKAKMIMLVMGTSPPLAEEEKFQKAFDKLKALIPDNFLELPEAEKLRIAQQVKGTFHLPESAEELRFFLVEFKTTGVPLETLAAAFQNEKFTRAFTAQAARTSDVQQAFEASLQQAPPELQEQYRRYQEVCQSESMADVFKPPPKIDGARVEPLSPDQSLFAVHTIKADGIVLHMGENHRGEVHFGSMVRDVALYSVNGKPRLFIYDENADKGVVGPVDPIEVRAALSNIVIDTYFSEKFREFSTSGTEQDPTKVVDTALFKIVHAFLPEMRDGSSEELYARQQRMLANLARLLVAPDKKYVSIADKVEFLRRVVDDPAQQDAARKFLAENDFSVPENTVTISDFENLI